MDEMRTVAGAGDSSHQRTMLVSQPNIGSVTWITGMVRTVLSNGPHES